jgi:hypothetical protein
MMLRSIARFVSGSMSIDVCHKSGSTSRYHYNTGRYCGRKLSGEISKSGLIREIRLMIVERCII